jgi:hypothetical protein
MQLLLAIIADKEVSMHLSNFGVNFAQVKEAAEKGRTVGKRFTDRPGEVSEVRIHLLVPSHTPIVAPVLHLHCSITEPRMHIDRFCVKSLNLSMCSIVYIYVRHLHTTLLQV